MSHILSTSAYVVCKHCLRVATYNPVQPLEKLDSRVHVLPLDAYTWDTYQTIEDQGLLDDVETKPWDAGGESLPLLTENRVAHLHGSA
jgi:hypothetical protein